MDVRLGDFVPDKDEFEVADILLDLARLIRTRETPFFNLRWGAKRKRSAEEEAPSPSVRPPSPTNNGEKSKVKVEALSPATPLSFSPSDTDCKTKASRRKSFKKKILGLLIIGISTILQSMKELKEMADALIAQQKQLKLEICKVENYRDGLEEKNLRLKSIQSKWGLLPNAPHHKFDLNFTEKSGVQEELIPQPYPVSDNQCPEISKHPSHNLENRHSLSRSGMSFEAPRPSQKAHLELPDLNCLAEEAAPGFGSGNVPDLSKAAAAAQARKRRVELNRGKISMAFRSPRFRL